MSATPITIGEQTYEIPTKQAAAISKIISDVWEKLGRPETPLSESGEKLMKIIIATWEDTYPTESREWYEMRREYQNEESDIHTQIKGETGGSLASYPYYIYLVMKRVFPNIRLHEKEFCKKLVRKYPMFRMSTVRS